MLRRDQVGDLDSPKHGKIDETGAPHVGGNTWAGGTGGRDTAGNKTNEKGSVFKGKFNNEILFACSFESLQ